MELRVLEYFLAVAREQNITAAAESLHLSQPTLSRQIKDMENDFGKQLFIRGSRRITLTEEGIILRKRAEEILNLVQKTEKDTPSDLTTLLIPLAIEIWCVNHSIPLQNYPCILRGRNIRFLPRHLSYFYRKLLI